MLVTQQTTLKDLPMFKLKTNTETDSFETQWTTAT